MKDKLKTKTKLPKEVLERFESFCDRMDILSDSAKREIHSMVIESFIAGKKSISKKRSETIAKLMDDYSEEIEWDNELGTLSINGQKWIPESSI